MFDSVIANIIEGVDIKRKLLRAPAYRFNIDKGDVVYSVKKLWNLWLLFFSWGAETTCF